MRSKIKTLSLLYSFLSFPFLVSLFLLFKKVATLGKGTIQELVEFFYIEIGSNLNPEIVIVQLLSLVTCRLIFPEICSKKC